MSAGYKFLDLGLPVTDGYYDRDQTTLQIATTTCGYGVVDAMWMKVPGTMSSDYS